MSALSCIWTAKTISDSLIVQQRTSHSRMMRIMCGSMLVNVTCSEDRHSLGLLPSAQYSTVPTSQSQSPSLSRLAASALALLMIRLTRSKRAAWTFCPPRRPARSFFLVSRCICGLARPTLRSQSERVVLPREPGAGSHGRTIRPYGVQSLCSFPQACSCRRISGHDAST